MTSPTVRRQGEAAAFVSCLYRTRLGSFGDFGLSPGWKLQFLGLAAPVRAAESCHRCCWWTEMLGGTPADDLPGVLNFAPPVELGFGKLGWAPVPGIFHHHPNDFQ